MKEKIKEDKDNFLHNFLQGCERSLSRGKCQLPSNSRPKNKQNANRFSTIVIDCVSIDGHRNTSHSIDRFTFPTQQEESFLSP